ncbi:hypothetical protein DITRI_Ditri12bG0158400 [Diplodiscus trichospermus]
MTDSNLNLLQSLEPKRDAYGFTVRPQHIQTFGQFVNIYKRGLRSNERDAPNAKLDSAGSTESETAKLHSDHSAETAREKRGAAFRRNKNM